MLYVVDTHSLIWFLTEDKKLGKNALKVLEDADKGKHIIIIPTIVLAEFAYICEKRNLKIKFEDILKKLKESFNYIPYNLDLDTIIRSLKLERLKDIHDRLIVAVANILNAKIITKDKSIDQSGYVSCVW